MAPAKAAEKPEIEIATEMPDKPAKEGFVRFFNLQHPGDTFLVRHDTRPEAILNPMTAQELYATFVNGRLDTDNDEVIAWCRSDQGRAKGCREFDNIDDRMELADSPELLERMIQQRAEILAREMVAQQRHEESYAGR